MKQWKSIPGFEDMYIVSNHGEVKGLKRLKITSISGKTTEVPERYLKPYPGGRKGNYLRVCLSKHNKKYIKPVHRLVAELFIDNPLNKKAVNHIDGNSHNNHIDNLEWCTDSENMQHYYSLKRKKEAEKNASLFSPL